MSRQTKSVDPSLYTHEYYLTDCTGFEEFKESFGDKLESRFTELFRRFRIKEDMLVLDIGCGRGEAVLYAAKQGAKAIGIDYSKEAINIANGMKKRKRKELSVMMEFYVMNAKQLKFQKSLFDVVILTDVVEHLYNKEIDLVFSEIKRVLKQNGTIILHSAPNKLFNDIGYKYYCYPVSTFLVKIWNTITWSKYPNIANPKNLRTKSHATMHVNEPSYFSLKKLFNKHNFVGSLTSSNITVKKVNMSIRDIMYNFLVFLHPFSTKFPLNIFFGSDFIAVLKNKK